MNETDRELLKCAAQAAGYNVKWVDGATSFNYTGYLIEFEHLTHYNEIPVRLHWNPLADDGDALRLAVKLRIHLDFGTHEDVPYVCAHRNGIEMIRDPVSAIESSYELDIIDWNAATRRAIVRAAAEIGESMP